MDRIRVLIADDHPIFRQGLRGILEAEPDIDVVGEASDGKQAIALARAVAPDVILVDVHMPNSDGLEVARTVKLHLPRAGIILMTAYDDEEQLFQAIKVGASAFFLKDIRPDEMLDGIRRAAAGEYLINESVLTKPLVASRVLKQFRDLSMVGQEMEPLFVPLSAREIEVLDYIARGNSNKEIARALKISDQTVKNHITSILRKLAVNDRTQAVVYALLPAVEGRSVELVDDLGGQRLDGQVELGLYRIAQAALDATGAAAGRVVIRLGRDGGRARLTVEADTPIAEGSTELATIRDWAAAL